MKRVPRFAVTTMTLLALATTTPAVSNAAADDGSCAGVEVIFARGTLEPPGPGATGQAFTDALTTHLGGIGVDVYPVNYPGIAELLASRRWRRRCSQQSA